MANYATKLQRAKDEINDLKGAVAEVSREIQDFRCFLTGPKFTGTENEKHICPRCSWDSYTEERKDWISTSDVLAKLEQLASRLREVL